MKLFFLPHIFFFILSGIGYGQTIDTKSLDSLAATWDKPNSPGGYLAIFKDGETVYSSSFGYANLETKESFTEQTRFPISSMSKHITAICILKLVQEGKLKLNQNIVDFFPELDTIAKNILVSDLLNHTSGLGSWTSAATMCGKRIHEFEKSPYEWLVDHGQIEFQPGTKFSYGNTSFYLAGEIVRKITNKSLAEFSNDELFSKLGMKNTFYLDNPNQEIKGKAQGYVLNGKGEYLKRNCLATHMGPVGVYTTIEDFKIWDSAIQNKLVLRPELLDLLSISYRLNDDSKTYYGYGQWIYEYNGIKQEFHSGGDYDWGYKSYYARFPDYNLTFVIFSNDSDLDRNQAVQLVKRYMFESEFPEGLSEANRRNSRTKTKKTKFKKVKNLKRYEGMYYSKSIDASYSLKLNEDNDMILTTGNIDPIILTWVNNVTANSEIYHIQKIRLSAIAPTLRFKIEGDKVIGFSLNSGGVNNISFVKMVK